MFQGANFPLGGFMVAVLGLAVVGVVALLGGGLAVALWAVEHVRWAP